jgi:hypothetical protein
MATDTRRPWSRSEQARNPIKKIGNNREKLNNTAEKL